MFVSDITQIIAHYCPLTVSQNSEMIRWCIYRYIHSYHELLENTSLHHVKHSDNLQNNYYYLSIHIGRLFDTSQHE